MTYVEKKAALAAHKSEQTMWTVLVAFLGINLGYAIYNVIKFFMDSGETVSGLGILSGMVMVVVFLALALNAWITWGVYRIERWVTMWMWIGLVLSLLSFNLVGIIIQAAALFMYKKVLKAVYPAKTAPAPAPQA